MSHSLFFFFKQKTAYELRISDWSSDVCSSDLVHAGLIADGREHGDLRLIGELDYVPLQNLPEILIRAARGLLTEGLGRYGAGFDFAGPVDDEDGAAAAIGMVETLEAIEDAECIAQADRKSKRLNSSHYCASRMPSSA